MMINKATTVPLASIGQQLNPHIETMNRDGWEMMTVTIETIGTIEVLLMFWKKPAPEAVATLPTGFGATTPTGTGAT